jgi:hypothetical protein
MMGIRKTLLIASTALVLPLAAHASPLSLNVGQGIESAASTSHAPDSNGLYQEANSVKEWWENIGEGGEESGEEGGEEGGENNESGERGDNNWNENGERGEDRWNERGQYSWWDEGGEGRDGNWWNESGNSGRHNWWNESGENGNKKNKWKHNEGGEEGGESGRWNEKGEWGDD